MGDVKGGGSQRRGRAWQTRRRILESALKEFLQRGFHGATIAAIAEGAGVAPQTVYFVFHTKAELGSAVIDAAVLGEEEAAPQETAWWTAMEDAASAREALQIFVQGAGPLFARASPVSEVLRAAALTDPELLPVLARHDELQRAGYAQVVDGLQARGALRPRLDPGTATDILLALVSDATYVHLTSARGWTHESVIAWLADAAPRLLLRDDPSESPPVRR